MANEIEDKKPETPAALKPQEQQGPVQIFIGGQQPTAQNPAETALQQAGVPAVPVTAPAPKKAQPPAPVPTPPPQQAPVPQAMTPAPAPAPTPAPAPVQTAPTLAPEEKEVPTSTFVPALTETEKKAEIKQPTREPATKPTVLPALQAAAEKITQPKTPQDIQAETKTAFATFYNNLKDEMAKGEIQPKTYADLYADKSIPGKIGMLFATMISGMGAGLTHQPNAVLQMMDNMIARDLEAQKAQRQYKQNLLGLGIDYATKEMQIEQLRQQGLLTEQQVKTAKAEAEIKGFEYARMFKNADALHKMAEEVRKLREQNSPLLPQAEANLAAASQFFDSKSASLADLAAARQAMLRQYMGAGAQVGNGAGGAEAEFKQRMQFLRSSGQDKLAEDQEAKHFAGVAAQANRRIADADRDKIYAMTVLDDKMKDLMSFAKQHVGTVDPSVLQQGKQKAEEAIAFYNQTVDRLGMTPGRLEWLEKQIASNPTSIFSQAFGSNARLKEITTSNENRKNLLLQSYGIPIQGYKKSTQTETPMTKEGMIVRNPQTGERLQLTNGQWVKVP